MPPVARQTNSGCVKVVTNNFTFSSANKPAHSPSTDQHSPTNLVTKPITMALFQACVNKLAYGTWRRLRCCNSACTQARTTSSSAPWASSQGHQMRGSQRSPMNHTTLKFSPAVTAPTTARLAHHRRSRNCSADIIANSETASSSDSQGARAWGSLPSQPCTKA